MNVFQNQVTARAIKVSQENFAVAFSRYTRFEDFKEEVLSRLGQFCEMFDIGTVLRTGLRYVNHIVIPPAESVSTVTQFVRPFIDFDRVNIDWVDQFVTEVRIRRSNFLVTLRGVLLSRLEDGRRIYVLDIDCHGNTQQLARDIPKILDAYHEMAQVYFLDHITDRYKDHMRGKS